MAEDTDQWRALMNTVSVKGGEFLDYLSNSYLLKNNFAPYG
jgi:hypothetical protein